VRRPIQTSPAGQHQGVARGLYVILISHTMSDAVAIMTGAATAEDVEPN
jgi:hypothetical protein